MSSLALIGVEEHEWLGHGDGSLPDVPFETAVAQVAALIERTRPDVIVTFGPDGMTGHPDHQTVSAWVTEAWRRAGCPGCPLVRDLDARSSRRSGKTSTEQLGILIDEEVAPVTPASDLALELQCDEDVLDLKYQVLRAHASQTAVLEEMLGTELFRRWWSTEFFVAVAHEGKTQ